MFYLLVFMILSSSVMFYISRGKYNHMLKDVKKREFPLKELLPIGLLFLELTGYKYKSSYDRGISIISGELYGNTLARDMLKVFWANRIIYIMIGITIILTICQFTGPGNKMLIFLALLVSIILVTTDRELRNKQKRRKISIQFAFPDFINKFTLLINAGMTTRFAWEKIAAEAKKEEPLQKELRCAVMDMKSGVPEIKAYERFSKRCGIPEITRLVSVLVQNIRKGNSELVSVLRISGEECWHMRKNVAKKMGEEASTKMIFPLAFMLIAILLIAITPAILALKGF